MTYPRTQIRIMWLLASLFYAYQYVLRVLPNIMMDDIMGTFQMDASLFGQFAGIYYVGYVLAHIPLGLLFDRFGPRLLMPLCALLTVFGMLPLIYSNTWLFPTLGRALVGIGSSGAILGVFKVIRMTFPETKFTRMLGLSVTIGLMGAIYGGAPVNYLLEHFGWRTVLGVICSGAIVLSALMAVFIAPYQRTHTTQGNILKQIKTVFSNKMVWLVCLLGGSMVGPLEGFADVWGAKYLMTAYHLPPETASFLPSLMFLGMCVGSPSLSYVADRFGAYFNVIILSGWVMGLCFLAMFFLALPTMLLGVIFFVVGIFCAYQIPVIYKASSYVPSQNIGLTTAAANMIIMMFGYFFHGAMGSLMDAFWTGQMDGDLRLYTASNFIEALIIIPIGLFIGAIGFTVLKWRQKKA